MGLGSGTFVRPPPGTELDRNLGTEENRSQRVGDRMVEKTGLNDDKVREVLEQFSRIITEDAKTCMHWTHSQENQGPWLKKTMVSLWLISGTIKGRMIDVLML